MAPARCRPVSCSTVRIFSTACFFFWLDRFFLAAMQDEEPIVFAPSQLASRYMGKMESIQAPTKAEVEALNDELAEAHRLCEVIKLRAEEIAKAKDAASELFKVEEKLQQLSTDTSRWLSCCNKDVDNPVQGPAPPMSVADAMNQELKVFQDLYLNAKCKREKLETRLLKRRCEDIEAATGCAMVAYQEARSSREESLCQAQERLKKEIDTLADRILDLQSQQLAIEKDSDAREAVKKESEEMEAVKTSKVAEWRTKCAEVEKEWERVIKANTPQTFSFLRGRRHDKAASTTPVGTPKAKREGSSAAKLSMSAAIESPAPSPAGAPNPASSPAPKKKGGSFLRGPPPN